MTSKIVEDALRHLREAAERASENRTEVTTEIDRSTIGDQPTLEVIVRKHFEQVFGPELGTAVRNVNAARTIAEMTSTGASQMTTETIISTDGTAPLSSEDDARQLKEQQELERRQREEVEAAALVQAVEKAEEVWADVELALKSTRRVLFHGPPGTGKSFAGIKNLHTHKPEDIARLYITLDTPSAEIRGHYLPNEEGNFSWHDGPASATWRSAGRLIIDEIDKASGDVLTLLLGFLDDEESAQITLPNGERITPGKDWQVVASTNEAPTTLPEALLDRFDAVISVPSPNPAAFSPDLWHSADLADAAKKATYLAKGVPRGAGGRPIRLRSFKSIDKITARGIALEDAARLVIGKDAATWLSAAVELSRTRKS